MKVSKLIFQVAICLFVAACGGTGKQIETEPVPPPIDENLLNLVPYEADLVLTADIMKLRSSSIWGIIDKAFKTNAVNMPAPEAVNPLMTCNEAVMAFMDSEQHGNQLIVILKSEEQILQNAVSAFQQKQGSSAISVEGFNGTKTEEMLFLPVTSRTFIFGNETLVRMAAKAGTKKSRSILDNKDFANISLKDGESARVLYRAGLNVRTIEKFKKSIPQISPNAVSAIEGSLRLEGGAQISLKISMETQMDASKLAQELTGTLSKFSRNMIVVLLGIDWLLKKFVITVNVADILIDINLSEQDINNLNSLAERLQKLQDMLKGIGE